MRFVISLLLALFVAACDQPMQPVATALPRRPENIKAADRLNIVGWFYESSRPRGTVLLFHQAGSSKNEYDTIGPRLAAQGYDAFAIDARAGGDLFGDNSTVHMIGESRPYAEAKQDMQAAIDWAKQRGKPIILWGSSYSAAMVFELAKENAGAVKGVLAFSPGEYLGTPGEVKAAAAAVKVPVYITSANIREEVTAARAIYDAVAASGKQFFTPSAQGVHGSATLIAARNASGAEANWRPVEVFLRKLVPLEAGKK